MHSPAHPVSKELLIVFAREPQKGRVKTRLAGATSDEFALQVYQRLLDRALRLARSVSRERPGQLARSIMIAFDSGGGGQGDKEEAGILSKAAQRLGALLWRQPEADLGERMQAAFEIGFSAGAEKIVLIGCDAPTLSWAIVSQAFTALQSHRITIAPTTDGGYCLIGLTQPWPELFAGMQWSHAGVYRDTVARAGKEPVFSLGGQLDIDHLHDWTQWLDERGKRGLPETTDW